MDESAQVERQIKNLEEFILPYSNGSYKDNMVDFHIKLYSLYNSILKGYDGKTTKVIHHVIKHKKTTNLMNMFLKDLAEVFTIDRKSNFSIYAKTIDYETPSKNNVKEFTINIDTKTLVSMNNTEEYLKLLNTVGLENTMYAIYLLDKITHYRS